MDSLIANEFSSYLAPREAVRWTGRPAQGLALRPSDLFAIPFAIIWLALVSTMFTSGRFPPDQWWFAGMFVVVGLYFAVGRFIADALVRARTRYALTDRRALILKGLFGESLVAVELKQLQELHYKPGPDGRGTIVFGPDNGAVTVTFGRRYAPLSPEFFRTSDANGAYALIQQTRQAS